MRLAYVRVVFLATITRWMESPPCVRKGRNKNITAEVNFTTRFVRPDPPLFRSNVQTSTPAYKYLMERELRWSLWDTNTDTLCRGRCEGLGCGVPQSGHYANTRASRQVEIVERRDANVSQRHVRGKRCYLPPRAYNQRSLNQIRAALALTLLHISLRFFHCRKLKRSEARGFTERHPSLLRLRPARVLRCHNSMTLCAAAQ